MKEFSVYLHDGRTATVFAETYRHETNRFVFEKASASEVQFFVDSEVVGITELTAANRPAAVIPEERSPSLLAKAEAQAINEALAECSGNRTHAAKKLGISRRALLYKLKALPKQ